MISNLRISLCVTAASISALGGCWIQPDPSGSRALALESIDGLKRADASVPGTLELRDDHGIGGYDELYIPEATLSYKRHSLRLTHNAREVFLVLVRETLIDASTAAGIPVVDEPGLCVMEINLGAIGLDLNTASSADQLATLTMVMQFRDSLSGEPVLRYSTEQRVENPEENTSHDSKLRRGLGRIIADLNLAGSMSGAGLADDAIRPGCKGTFAALGRAARQQR